MENLPASVHPQIPACLPVIPDDIETSDSEVLLITISPSMGSSPEDFDFMDIESPLDFDFEDFESPLDFDFEDFKTLFFTRPKKYSRRSASVISFQTCLSRSIMCFLSNLRPRLR